MFDYIMFLNYGSMIAIGFFALRLLAGTAVWYTYEVGRYKDIRKLQLALKGQYVKSYGIAKTIAYLIISILIFISIK